MKNIIDPISEHLCIPCKAEGDEHAFSESERKKVLDKLMEKTFFPQNSEDHVRMIKGMTHFCKFLLEGGEWEKLEAELLDESAAIYSKSHPKNDDTIKEALQKFRLEDMACDPEADAECMEQLYGKTMEVDPAQEEPQEKKKPVDNRKISHCYAHIVIFMM